MFLLKLSVGGGGPIGIAWRSDPVSASAPLIRLRTGRERPGANADALRASGEAARAARRVGEPGLPVGEGRRALEQRAARGETGGSLPIDAPVC